jgi:hypothetical protein
MDIQTIADKAGRELTSKGNLEVGSHDGGKWSPPGGPIAKAQVIFYLLANGDYRAVIDDRHGSNQGQPEWHGGEVIQMDGADLAEAIELARAHIDDLEDGDALMRAWRIAASEARATMRAVERATDASSMP